MQQYYIDRSLNIDDEYFFNGEDTHHIKNVLRLNKNELIRLVYHERAYLALIDYKDSLPYARVIENDEFKRDLHPQITLIQGLIKLDKFELVLQKACELGVSKIVPLSSFRVNLKKDIIELKRERLQKIILESCKQCKRESLVKLAKVIDIKECKQYKSELNFVAYEADFYKGNNLINFLEKGKSVTIIIGCEGGFKEEEIVELNKAGYVNVGLGKRILRAETAGLYSLSVIGAINEA